MPLLQFKNILIQIFLTASSLAGFSQSIDLEPLCTLPKELNENSGMIAWGDTLFWFINDSGNEPFLYGVDIQCNIVRKVYVSGAENIDWEDIAIDSEGNIYIADIGNNSNKRQTLIIYKISKKKLLSTTDTILPEFSICFFYANQKNFPPEKEDKYFDAEALFYHNDSLTLITKNRTYPFNGKALIYRIPLIEGNHKLDVKDTLFTGLGLMELQWISGADILENSVVAALGYDKLIFFNVNNPDKKITINLGLYKQFESISFGEYYLYISNEKNTKNKPLLYRIPIAEFIKYYKKVQDF